MISLQLHESLSDPIFNTIKFLNEVMGQYPDAISFAPGAPHPSQFENIDVNKYLQIFKQHLCKNLKVSEKRAEEILYQYGPTEGLINDLIMSALKKDSGINTTAHSIVVTVGAQEALLIVLRTLFSSPSDCLILPSPCYPGVRGAALLLDIKIIEINETETGIDLESLENECNRSIESGQSIKALYVAPDFSNPDGSLLCLEKRCRLLELAEKFNFLILEDNAYAFTASSDAGLPSLKSLDKNSRVIYIGTFSKCCVPGARVGYIIADQAISSSSDTPKLLAEKLVQVKSMTTINTSSICQALIGGMLLEHSGSIASLEYLKADFYRKNLEFLLKCLETKIPASDQKRLGISWNKPQGGFFIRVRLPIAASIKLLELSGQKYGVLWTPMSFFYSNKDGNNEIRLSCSYLTNYQMEEGVSRLVRFFEEIFSNLSLESKSNLRGAVN